MPEITPIDISLDLYDNKIICINAKQEDIDSRYICVTVTEKGKLFSLNKDTFIAQVRCRKPDGKFVHNDATITDDGKAIIKLTQQMLAVDGKCLMDLTLLQYPVNKDFDNYNMTVLSPMSFYVNVVETPTVSVEIISTNEFNTMMGCISTMFELQVETEETLSDIKGTKEIILLEEQARKNNEEVRKINEKTRENNESIRIANEEVRDENETVRKDNEEVRISNENQRQTSISNILTECNEKITEMDKTTELFNQSVKGVINDDEISTTTTFSSEYISKLSNPNLLINGDFQVWQRGTEFVINDTTTHNSYYCDRWNNYIGNTSEPKNLEINSSNGFYTVTNKKSDVSFALCQKIEINDSMRNSLSNKDVTLSFDVVGAATRDYEASMEVLLADSGKPLQVIALKDYRPSATKTRVTLTGTMPDLVNISSDSIMIEVKLITSKYLLQSNTTLQFANVKFEQCSFATPFISRTYTEELQMCQRYYQKCSTLSPILYKPSSTQYRFCLPFKEMRIIPTLNVGWSYGYSSNNTTVTISSFSISENSERRIVINATTSGELGECYGMIVDYVLDAEMY